MFEIPYEGPRFAPKDYRAEAYRLKQQLAELRSVLLSTADALEQSEGRKEWADRLRTALEEQGK